MKVLEIKTELEREEDGYELFSQGLVGVGGREDEGLEVAGENLASDRFVAEEP
jgi:hypothetical protein